MTCNLCNGTMVFMGVLGNYAWYRCQDCGNESHKELDNEPCEPDEEDQS